MINLFDSNYNSKKSKKSNKSNTTTQTKISNEVVDSLINNINNMNKKSFLKQIKHSAKLKANANRKKYKPRSVENYCKTFHKIDILGKVNKNLYNSCKIHKYCRQTKCNKIDEKNAKELTKKFGNNYNMYIQSHLKENCPSTITSKNIKKCENKTLKELYNKYGIVDIYNKLNNCDKVICSKEKKIFYDNLFRTKQIKLKKNQRLLLAQKDKLEEPDMDLIVNGDL
jgi:hypothetical protein